MARLAPGFFGLALFILWIWAVFDVIATDRMLIRNLDKMMWIFLVIFVPTLGAVAWLALGRPVNASSSPGGNNTRPNRGTYKSAPRGPEDSDAWNALVAPKNDGFETTAAKERRLLEWEAELAELESDLDDEDHG
jgi:hypothetical protein